MAPETFVVAFVTVLGAMVGSFLNVCIHRLPRKQSIVWPPSACPSCGRRLAWFENVPIVGYLALGGRCRTCRAPIGPRYAIVEALTAAMFGVAAWYFGPTPLLASRLVLGSALIVLFAIDLEHQLLPNAITLPFIIVGFVFSFFVEPGWRSSLIGILVGGGSLLTMFYLWLWLRKQEALGMGDPKMLAMIGAFVGWKLTILTLVLASFSGSIVGVALIATRRARMQTLIPFGCFLAVGAAIAATVGPAIVDWYLSFY
ncbi:MAG TPA: prepilin peptidase [Vicinamibacterales bacterium]|nr:prepilin peptidase [Vicinamibacterales bacterium]